MPAAKTNIERCDNAKYQAGIEQQVEQEFVLDAIPGVAEGGDAEGRQAARCETDR